MIFVAEITGFNITTGLEEKFYFSTEQFVTKPSDTPANIAFVPRITNPGTIGIQMDIGSVQSGLVSLEIGELTIINSDGAYDYLTIERNFGGRDIHIRYGLAGAAYPAGFTTFFKGTCDTIEISYENLIFRLKDKSYIFDRALVQTEYGGTNSLPNGIDGTPDDIKGDPLPRLFAGPCYNLTPKFVNTSKLIYQCSNNSLNTVSAVYDQGVALTAGADYATNALLQAATGLSANTYYTCKAEGLIRLGSTPNGQVTMDVYRGSSAATRTTAQILSSIASLMGVTAYAADVTALDTLNSDVLGMYIDTDATALEVMNALAQSIQAFFYFDRLGQFRMGQIQGPIYLSSYSDLYESDILDIEQVASLTNVPVWKSTLTYKNNETVQNPSDLAGSVSQARRNAVARQFLKVSVSNSGLKSQYLNAREITISTRLVDATASDTENTRVWNMFNYPTYLYNVTIPIEKFNYDLMSGINMYYTRFNLWDGGAGYPRSCAVVGYSLNPLEKSVTLTLWG